MESLQHWCTEIVLSETNGYTNWRRECKSRDLEHVYEAFYIAAVRLDVSVQQVDYILT